ncbi:BACON domain-containing protein [uncultured Bacteroides sp.]|uniref:BACON domain-containing protein n=1 Tax=uncultured Bacteroides sp. TaxID=162156 RepID=UPI00280AF794|nr:M64 family metallopeptidase [uncultured Bacteroides sp.]
MKAHLFNLYLIFLLLCVSCQKEGKIVPFENVTKSVTLPSVEGKEASISFTCSGAWNVTTDATWLSLSPLSGGAGERTVTVKVISENNSNLPREAKVKLTSGDAVYEVSVSQEVGDYVLPEQGEYLAKVDGGSLVVRFESNVDVQDLRIYTPSEPENWLRKEISTRAVLTGKHEVVLNVSPNKGGMSRSAYLLFMRESSGAQKELAAVKISQLGGQVLESVDFSADGKVDTLQKHTEGRGIPVVLMGDGFVDQEITNGIYRRVMETAMENLFSEEPIRSLRPYFDVFMVQAVSENNDFGMGYQTAFSCRLAEGKAATVTGDDSSVQVYVGKVLKQPERKSSLAVVVLNTSVYAGTTYFGYQDEKGRFVEFAIAYCPVVEDLKSESFRRVLVHEAIGHGLGKLEDEYSYPEKGSISTLEKQKIKAMKANGWSQNVDFTAVADSVCWAFFLKDSRYRNSALGVYEGGCTYPKGVYRPSDDSMMNSTACGFNAPSRKALYDKVMRLGKGVEQVALEDFVAFDRSHLPQSKPTRSVQIVERLACPVWTGYKLRH